MTDDRGDTEWSDFDRHRLRRALLALDDAGSTHPASFLRRRESKGANVTADAMPLEDMDSRLRGNDGGGGGDSTRGDAPRDTLGARKAEHVLGMAIARRDWAAVAPIEAAATPLARLRLARARVLGGLETSVDPAWAPIDRDRLAAAQALAPPGRVTRGGSTGFLFDQAIPIVEGVIDGHARGYFIVDTGAPHTALSRRWCDANGIAVEGGVVHSVDDGAGHPIPAVTLRIATFVVGAGAGAAAAEVPAIAFDFPPGLDVAGILSPLDAFGGAVVTLDYAARRLVVGGEVPAEPGVPLFWDGGVPLVHARVGGVDAFLMLDSGAGGEVLCASFAAQFETAHLAQAETQTAAGAVPVQVGLTLALAIGEAPETMVAFAVKECAGTGSDIDLIGRDGMIGGGWLAGRILSIGVDRLTMWVYR